MTIYLSLIIQKYFGKMQWPFVCACIQASHIQLVQSFYSKINLQATGSKFVPG